MDGVLIINKPKGYTSHDIVNIIRKELHIKKVGHTGTLDPNATGVLPILIGNATKISKYLIEHDKTYIAEIKLGEKTTTGDSEGEIIETRNVEKNQPEKIQEVLTKFLGKQKQTPPKFSAIKINGKKAYEYARTGQDIKLEQREIEIFSINLLSYENNNIKFKVKCSKGTYIRTLCEDIAETLGTVGYMNSLERIQVDNFHIEKSVTIEQIRNNSILIEKNIISIEEIFRKCEKIELNDYKLNLFFNGVQLTFNQPEAVYRIYNKSTFIGLGVIHNNLLKRDVIV